MAGRLAFNPITVRTPTSESPGRLRNYRPAFESIVLGRQSDGLDPEMVRSLQSIIGAAYRKGDEKGVGDKVREIFADFARNIDNNIVKLASQRIGDVVNGVSSEHLPEFLSAMHREMLRNPERADAVPEAMLSTYRMSGGRLGSDAIVRAVRIGFAKSGTACPKEVSRAVRTEYESGGLDHIGEIASIRNEHGPQNAIEVSYAPAMEQVANDNMPVPEALPIAHFIAPKMPDEPSSGASYIQEVPQIVASRQREEIRERRKSSKPGVQGKAANAPKVEAVPAEKVRAPAQGRQALGEREPPREQARIRRGPPSASKPERADSRKNPEKVLEQPRAKGRRPEGFEPKAIIESRASPKEIGHENDRVIISIAKARLAVLPAPFQAKAKLPSAPAAKKMERGPAKKAKDAKAPAKAPKALPPGPITRARRKRPNEREVRNVEARKKNVPKPAKARREKMAREANGRKRGPRTASAPIRGPKPAGAKERKKKEALRMKNAPKADTAGLMCSYRLRRPANSRAFRQHAQARPPLNRIISRIMERARPQIQRRNNF